MKIVTQHQVHQAMDMCKRQLLEAERYLAAATTPEEKAVWSLVVRRLRRGPQKRRGCCG